MSTVFNETVRALGDPDLRSRVLSATSAEERAEILRAAGVQVPSHVDVNSGLIGLADVAAAGTTTTPNGKKSGGGGGGDVDLNPGEEIAAAVGAAAAG